MTTWHTIASVRKEWADASKIEDGTLTGYLNAARQQCETYGVFTIPEGMPTEWIPDRFRIAQLLQARDLWNARSKNSGEDSSGLGEYALPVYQMTNTVKGLLRPRRGGIGLG